MKPIDVLLLAGVFAFYLAVQREGWKHALAAVILLVGFATAALTSGCQQFPAHAPARVVETVGTALERTYLETGRAAVLAHASRADRAEALERHRERWSPVWAAWRAFVDSHNAAVDGDVSGVIVAWCDLVNAYTSVGQSSYALPNLYPCEAMP